MVLVVAGAAANDVRVPRDQSLPAMLAARLAEPTLACGGAYLDTARLAPFYAGDRPEPLWIAEDLPDARAARLREFLAGASREGLVPANYRLTEIEHHWSASSPEAQVCLDLLLTDAFRRYASDVRRGRLDPREADPAWYPRPGVFNAVEALRAAASEGDLVRLLRDLPPTHAGYRRLREALARYEDIARDGGWPAIGPGRALEPGMRGGRVDALRSRLRAEGDLGRFTWRGDHYDDTLAAAVRHFQRRHGLHADGIVGPRTRAALNVPVGERLAQIRRTMERWRWLPRDLGDPHILVNSAGFRLDVMEKDRSVLDMRVIVGTPDQATPSFAATMNSLIINPYWNVPARIAREKLLPLQQRNPAFFPARDIRIYPNGVANAEPVDPASVNWKRLTAENFPYRVRQEPGPKNSMGRVAFVLPNPFDVFLHDTPERSLFERDRRTFSEGCVRIERFMPLALYTLRGNDGWDEARISEEIESLRHQKVALPRPLPVYVLYLTSWVDEAGVVHFADDGYRREGELARYYPVAGAS